MIRMLMTLAAALACSVLASPAQAGLQLSPAVVDLAPDQPQHGDLELFNDGTDVLYVVVEPSQIQDAGLASEKRVQDPDPKVLGLLATPNRLVLQPGERKYVRVAMLADPGDRDRVFRVTVKPVVGEVDAGTTGLKILVGYDVLVIQRPATPNAAVTGTRHANTLTLSNAGNTNAELFNGQQCDAGKTHCTPLPGHRLYAGASWDVTVAPGLRVDYSTKVNGQVTAVQY